MKTVADDACTVGTHGSNQQCDTSTDIRTGHTAGAKLQLTVVTNDNGTMGVAENNLCSHVDEAVDKEQTTLEHLLVEQYRATSLCRHHNEYAEQVGRKSGPGCVSQSHDGTVDERVDYIVLLLRNKQVVAIDLNFDPQTTESLGDNTQIAERTVLNTYSSATHGSHSDERTYLNHVRQQTVAGSVQLLDTIDSQQVTTDAADICSHAVEHVAELLYIRFAGCIIDGCSAFSQCSSHNDIGGTGDGCLVKQHVGTL